MDPSFSFEDGGSSDFKFGNRSPQAPWEFSRASEAVELEHLESKTTSVDYKIKEQLNIREKMATRKKKWKLREAGQESGTVEGDEEDDEDVDEIEKVYSKKKKNMDLKLKQNGKREDDASKSEDEDEESDEEEDDDNDDEINLEELNEDEMQEDDDDEEEEVEDDEEEDDYEEEEDDDEEEEFEKEEEEVEGMHFNNSSSKQNDKEKNSKEKKKSKDFNSLSFFSSEGNASFTKHYFNELSLSRPLIRACEELGYKKPTPIQSACIPLALSGRDISASAITGSGKTAAFSLPILERLLYRPKRISATRVLILTPTRELAVQIHSMIQKLAQFTDIRMCLVVGGLSNKLQESALRSKPDIVVATPGRMIDHLRNAMSVHLDDLAILVLDEADRLLDMGFNREVKEIVKVCPPNRQTLLFSATMTDEVSDLIKLSLKNPVRISADPKSQRPLNLTEEVIKIKSSQEGDKEAMVLSLCTKSFKSKVIIFCGMKVEAHRLKIIFGFSGLKAAELHGNLTQTMRLEALESFRKQESDFLIATDVAARGLDISGVETIISLECPKDLNTYIHRVGRTARAGKKGTAITFFTEKNKSLLKQIMKRAGNQIQSRTISPESIKKFRMKIENMEDDIISVSHQEYEEKALRKAEMEANKAQNMMDHASEIFSKPPKTWFQTFKEKKELNESVKENKFGTTKESKEEKKMISMQEAEEKKLQEKKKREKEKFLPRRKRRRLEQEREMNREEAKERRMQREEDITEDATNDSAKSKKSKSNKIVTYETGLKLAKQAKAIEKRRVSGKLPVKNDRLSKKGKLNKSAGKVKRRYMSGNAVSEPDRPLDILGADGDRMVKVSKSKSNSDFGGGLKRKPGVSKRQFKSKARYKRR